MKVGGKAPAWNEELAAMRPTHDEPGPCQFTLRSLLAAFALAAAILGTVQWFGLKFFERLLFEALNWRISYRWPLSEIQGHWLLREIQAPLVLALLCGLMTWTFNRLLGRPVRGRLGRAAVAPVLVLAILGVLYLGWALIRVLCCLDQVNPAAAFPHPDFLLMRLLDWARAAHPIPPGVFSLHGHVPRVHGMLYQGIAILFGVAGACLGLTGVWLPRRVWDRWGRWKAAHGVAMRRARIALVAAAVLIVPWLVWRAERLRWQWSDEARWAAMGAGAEHRGGKLVGLSFNVFTLSGRSYGTSHFGDDELLCVKGLDDLEDLGLAATQITDEGLLRVAQLTQLKTLDLSETNVTGLGLTRLAFLAGLEKLDLSKTVIADKDLPALKAFPQLHRLSLDGTGITDEGLAHLNNCPQLAWLNLNGTRVTDAGLVHLQGLRDLAVLDLEGTQITDAGLEQLRGLPSLQHLNVRATRVTEAKVLEILQSARLIYIDRDDPLKLPW